MLIVPCNSASGQSANEEFPDFNSAAMTSPDVFRYLNMHFGSEIVDSVKLVALGEVSHGGYTPIAFKAQMVKYLVVKKEYRSLLIEGPDYIISKMRNYLNSPEVLDTSFISKWVKDLDLNEPSSTIYLKLFSWLKQYNIQNKHNPVEVFGFDIGIDQRFVNFILYRYITPYNLQETQSLIYKLATENSFIEQIEVLNDWFNLNQPNLKAKLDNREFNWLSFYLRTADNSIKYDRKNSNNNISTKISANLFRDSVLYQNVQFLSQNVKSIIWAHNAHVVAAGFKNMGNFLRERYKKSYFVIATDFPKLATVHILDSNSMSKGKFSYSIKSFTADPSSAARKLFENYNISQGIFSIQKLKDLGIKANINAIDNYGHQFVFPAEKNIINALIIFSDVNLSSH
ncbi:erythromycin esterase family protein [Pedobacter sp. V48]|uniref:erythromycin esterase family protein n=1 Tax=Pedobacter sp. V48 TaxID=509635 RepID=UPI001376DBF2|nr:erythromycin esterase family protein [Pedobacter sp. V48]